MDTPVCDFIRDYADRKALRLHMPGHKGTSFLGPERMDITEISGADVLYGSEGIIRRSEENAAALFGAARTVYSTEGSSLAIRGMLYLALQHARQQGKAPLIAAGRNAHKVFLTAAALLDIPIDWIWPEQTSGLLSCPVTAALLETHLKQMDRLPAAVYVTSPDYLGNTLDIRSLAQVCHRYGCLLLVDNAHGAYLRFLPESLHPMDLGADLCCDSAHKTLPVLTGGAYLHISHGAPQWMALRAEQAMALFASTSPSYLILQSLDLANRYLAEGYRRRLMAFGEQVMRLKEKLGAAGWNLTGDEPLKLTIMPKSRGYRGDRLAQLLAERNIICEFSDPDHLVLMLTPENGAQALSALEAVLGDLDVLPALTDQAPVMSRPLQIMTPREALFAPSHTLEVEKALGRILADPTVSCPPAIPIVACGERIDAEALALMRYYGVELCSVTEE